MSLEVVFFKAFNFSGLCSAAASIRKRSTRVSQEVSFASLIDNTPNDLYHRHGFDGLLLTKSSMIKFFEKEKRDQENQDEE